MKEIKVPTAETRPSGFPEKVLVLQTAFLGDLILTLPLIQAAKEVWPKADIWALTIPATAEILEGHPAIRGTLVYDKRGGGAGLRGLLREARQLREMSFALALIPHRSLRSALLALMAGIPERVGFQSSAGFFLLTRRVPRRGEVHELERNMDLLRAVGFSPTARSPRIYPQDKDRLMARTFLERHDLASNRILVAVAPGSVWPTKRWLPERFAEVIRRLRDMDVAAVLVGSSADRGLCLQIARQAGGDVPVAAGELSLLPAAALMEKCRVVVSNDSAAGHLAASVGRPVVSIFGPTIAEFGFAPYGLDHLIVQADVNCRPCGIHGGRRCRRRHFNCMGDITPERVLQAVHTVLDRPGGNGA